jgi:hypothetical protein
MPSDTLAPLTLGVGLACVFAFALLHAWWGVGLGGVICAGALIAWFWPRRVHADMPAETAHG